MRLTLLTTDYLPNIGGVAQHIYELARALAAKGNAIEIIAPYYSQNPLALWHPPREEVAPTFRVWRVPFCINKSIRFFSGQITGRLSKRQFTRALIERLRHNPPDVLHWHALDTSGYPAEAFAGPRVWTNHTSNFIDGIRTRQGLAHYRREASAADHIICPSEELADLTVEIGVAGAKVHFISNGVDSQRFRPDVDSTMWRRRLNLDSNTHLVLCPRRLEKKNGVRFFAEAALEVLADGRKNCVFAIAGNYTGPRHESDEDVVSELISRSSFYDSFRLLGRVENSEIPGLYAAADFIVMPSLLEATSLSAMEAMATGKAVLSTNVGGLPFLVRDGENGILVPPADSHALAEGMKRLLANPELRARQGAAGRQRVEEDLDWSKIARQTLEIYRRASAEFPRRP